MTKKKSKKDIKAERKMLVSVIEKAVRSEKENYWRSRKRERKE